MRARKDIPLLQEIVSTLVRTAKVPKPYSILGADQSMAEALWIRGAFSANQRKSFAASASPAGGRRRDRIVRSF